MSDKALICTVGLPRSGKSTWARRQRFPIVNPDSVRLSIHGTPFVASAEPLVWAIVKVMVSSLFEAGHNYVILDATCINKQSRIQWMSSQWKTYFKVITEPVNVCIERARKDGREDLIPVIERMYDQFELLGDDEEDWS